MPMGIRPPREEHAYILEADAALKEFAGEPDLPDIDDRLVLRAHLKSLCKHRSVMWLRLLDLREKVDDLRQRVAVLETRPPDPRS